MAKKQKGNNAKNNDDKCFQYDLTAALNYQKVKSTIQKEYQKLNHLLINIIGKRQIFHHSKDWKNLNQIINRLFLIFCM